MPTYTNNTNVYLGNDHLKVPPNTVNMPSIFFYNIDHITTNDTEPYYNPILFKNFFQFSGGESHTIELDDNIIKQDDFIFIQVISNTDSLNAIEICFNKIDNLPSLPLNNSSFHVNNNNRIKRIYYTIKPDCQGEILTLVTDKFTIADAIMRYDYKPQG